MEEEDSEKIIEKRESTLRKIFLGWVKDNYDKIFLTILAIAFIIRMWIFFKTFNQPIWWDAADYLSTAKRWAGVELNNIWYYRRGFLWPLFCAAFFKLGLGEKIIRFTEVLFSTGIVAISYFLIRDMFNKKLALLTSIGLTASWILLFFTGRPLTSIPATFLLLLSLFFFWKGYFLEKGSKYLYLFGIFYALAVLTRMQYLMFALPFIVLIFTSEKFKMFKNKKLWITFGVFLLILTPQIVSYTAHYGNPITDIMSHYFGISTSQNPANEAVGLSKAFDYFLDLPYMLSKYIFILFLIGVPWFFASLFLGFDKIFKNQNLQKKLFIFLWIATAFLVLGYMTLYVEQRYIIPTLPFLFLIISYPLARVGRILRKYTNKNFALFIVFLILIILLIPHLTLTNNLTQSKSTSYLEVKQAGEWIKQNSNPEDIILSVSLPQTMYYSERPTYPFDMASEGFRRRDTTIPDYGLDREGFENFIEDKKPKYLIISAFETHPDWAQQYINENQDMLLPAQAYMQNDQPVLIIYQFKYP